MATRKVKAHKRGTNGDPESRKPRAPSWPLSEGLRAALNRRMAQPGAPSRVEIGRLIGVTGQRFGQILSGESKSCPELPTVLKALGMSMSMLPGIQSHEAEAIDILLSVREDMRRPWLDMIRAIAANVNLPPGSGAAEVTDAEPAAWGPIVRKH